MRTYPRHIFLGLFLLTASVLSLELLQMRLLSFMLWHHLAYMVISIVLLGLGAGGALLAIQSERILARWDWWLAGSASVAGLSTVASFMFLSRLEFDSFELTTKKYAVLGVYYGVLVVPYLCAGLALGIIFTRGIRRIGSIYFIDLAGSAVGAYLFYLLIGPLGAPKALVVMSAMLALSGLCFTLGSFKDPSSWRLVALSGAAVVILALAIPWSDSLIPARPAPSKSLAVTLRTKEGANIVFTRWTPIARIDVLEAKESTHDFLKNALPGDWMKMITVDGDANTWMFQHPDVRKEVPSLPQNLTSYHAAFLLKKHPEVLIIGPGGGNEIFAAHQMGSYSVTGVELNSELLEVSRRRYADFTGYIYQSPQAEAVVGEGRSYIRRSERTFDIIQMSGVDTWAGLSSGAYVLAENYLYTVESFTDFLEHLKPDGILSVGRFRLNPPRESLRLVSLASKALDNLGLTNPKDHMVVISFSDPLLARLLVKRSPFEPEEVALLMDAVDRAGGTMYAAPGVSPDNPYSDLLAAYGTGQEQQFFDSYPYNVTPVYDDRPFFFEYYKWSRFWRDITNSGSGGQVGANRPVALTVLGSLLGAVTIFSVVLILLPLALFRRRRLHISHGPWVIGYFTAIGLAFMFVEIIMMQRLVLFLGHPGFAIPVVLASLLLSAGTGSFLSSTLPLSERSKFGLCLLGVPVVLLVLVLVLPALLDGLLGASFSVRVIASVAIVALPGVLMGMPFPLGLSVVARLSQAVIPWAWGINGVASVLGTILVIVVAMSLGFTWAMGVAAGLYLAALGLLWPVLSYAPSPGREELGEFMGSVEDRVQTI